MPGPLREIDEPVYPPKQEERKQQKSLWDVPNQFRENMQNWFDDFRDDLQKRMEESQPRQQEQESEKRIPTVPKPETRKSRDWMSEPEIGGNGQDGTKRFSVPMPEIRLPDRKPFDKFNIPVEEAPWPDRIAPADEPVYTRYESPHVRAVMAKAENIQGDNGLENNGMSL